MELLLHRTDTTQFPSRSGAVERDTRGLRTAMPMRILDTIVDDEYEHRHQEDLMEAMVIVYRSWGYSR